MNGPRVAIAVVIICLMVVTGTAGPVVGVSHQSMDPTSDVNPSPTLTSASSTDIVEDCAATPPADHADPDGNTSDVIGWVDGYWYNESLEVDSSAVSEDDLEAITAVTAAQVEALRCLPFDEVPPVDLLTREEWGDRIESDLSGGLPDQERLFMRAQMASMLMAGHDTDPEELLIEHRSGFPLAFYDTQTRSIGFISEDDEQIEIDQVILAHELTHALQHQHFSIEEVFEKPTNDEYMSSLAVIEGDAVLVERMYSNNCGSWVDECLRASTGSSEPVNWGLTIHDLAAYNAPLVAETFEAEGWSGVNQLLVEMPRSMVEVLQPDQYGTFDRESMLVRDRSTDHWVRVATPAGNHDVIGQHAITAMMIAPSYETRQDPEGPVEIVDPGPFQQAHSGGQLDYNHPISEGWQADQFYAYTNHAGDTASVWKIGWESEDQASEFISAYQQLLHHRGAERNFDVENTVFTFDESDEYDMAVGIEQQGTSVWIVTAPTTNELPDIHAGFRLNPSDEEDLSDRVTELERELFQLESALEQRDDRMDELEEQYDDLEMLLTRLEELLSDEGIEDIQALLDRLDEVEAELEENDDTGSDPIPGFGVIVAALAIGSIGLVVWLRRR